MTYEYKQYLAHYGVKGQKWGKRRYQYDDGSLTSEGRERYGIGNNDNRFSVGKDDSHFFNGNRDKNDVAGLAVNPKRSLKNKILGKAINVGTSLSKTAYKIGHEFAKRNSWKKMGAIVLNKKNYKIFGMGLPGR